MSEKKKPNPRKYTWKQVKRFKTFDEADIERNKLKKQGSIVKVKRCGPDGTLFKVIVGTKLSKETKTKGVKNATK